MVRQCTLHRTMSRQIPWNLRYSCTQSLTHWTPIISFSTPAFPLVTCMRSGGGYPENPQSSPKAITVKGVWAWGIQTGPFAVHKSYFSQVNFHNSKSQMQYFPFLVCREKGTQYWTPKVNESQGCFTLGYSIWTIWRPKNLFLENKFPLY